MVYAMFYFSHWHCTHIPLFKFLLVALDFFYLCKAYNLPRCITYKFAMKKWLTTKKIKLVKNVGKGCPCIVVNSLSAEAQITLVCLSINWLTANPYNNNIVF